MPIDLDGPEVATDGHAADAGRAARHLLLVERARLEEIEEGHVADLHVGDEAPREDERARERHVPAEDGARLDVVRRCASVGNALLEAHADLVEHPAVREDLVVARVVRRSPPASDGRLSGVVP